MLKFLARVSLLMLCAVLLALWGLSLIVETLVIFITRGRNDHTFVSVADETMLLLRDMWETVRDPFGEAP